MESPVSCVNRPSRTIHRSFPVHHRAWVFVSCQQFHRPQTVAYNWMMIQPKHIRVPRHVAANLPSAVRISKLLLPVEVTNSSSSNSFHRLLSTPSYTGAILRQPYLVSKIKPSRHERLEIRSRVKDMLQVLISALSVPLVHLFRFLKC